MNETINQPHQVHEGVCKSRHIMNRHYMNCIVLSAIFCSVTFYVHLTVMHRKTYRNKF